MLLIICTPDIYLLLPHQYASMPVLILLLSCPAAAEVPRPGPYVHLIAPLNHLPRTVKNYTFTHIPHKQLTLSCSTNML